MSKFIGRLLVVLALGWAGGVSAEATTPAAENEPVGIIANRFTTNAEFDNGQLNLSVETDLPDFAEVNVTVSRTYKEKGNASNYSIEYFTDTATVAKWRSPQTVQVDNAQWKRDLTSKQKEMSRIGLGFDVAWISDDIEVRMVVPLNQSNPRFGKRNEHLSGSAVRKDGLKVIRDEVSISYPIGAKIAELPSVSLDPLQLTVGQVYLVSRSTPLMPSPNPSDPIAALEKAKKISAGGGFKVINVKVQAGKPWYQVTLINTSTGRTVEGWINSTALIGQKLDTP
jgi:hypothetical protein